MLLTCSSRSCRCCTGTTLYLAKLRCFIEALWFGTQSTGTRWTPCSSSPRWLCKAGFSKPSVGRFRLLQSLISIINLFLLMCWKGVEDFVSYTNSFLLITWKEFIPPFLLSCPAAPAIIFLLRSFSVICGSLSDAQGRSVMISDGQSTVLMLRYKHSTQNFLQFAGHSRHLAMDDHHEIFYRYPW